MPWSPLLLRAGLRTVLPAGGESIQAATVICNRDLPAAYELLRAAPGPKQEAISSHIKKTEERLSNLDYR